MKKWISRLMGPALLVILIASCKEKPAEPATEISSTDTSSASPEWKLGVQMWTFHEFPFVTALAKADSAGIKFIEAFQGQPLGGDMKDTFGLTMSPESKSKIKTLLAEKGIQLVAMGVVVPNSVEEWKKNFELAREMGMQYITAEPLRQHLDTVNAMAGEYKILVAIHDHPNPSPYASPDSVVSAAKGRINIGACADIGHWARNGLDVVECLKKLEGRVIGVHLKDIRQFNDVKAEDTVLGTGVLKFPEILAELKRQHFTGMFSIEHEAHWENNVPDVIKNREYFESQVKALK